MATMKNYITTKSSKLKLINNENDENSVDLYSDEGFDMLSNLWIKVAAQKGLCMKIVG